jgi:hypothetical protein
MKSLCLRTMKGNVITVFLQNTGYGFWLISVYIIPCIWEIVENYWTCKSNVLNQRGQFQH